MTLAPTGARASPTKAASASPLETAANAVFWGMIESEGRAWRRAGRTPVLWWRDDDARRPSPALQRLLALARRFEVPLALAVIPDVDLTDLAEAIRDQPGLRAIQHGCDHVDRNEGGAFSAEFSPDAAPAGVAERIGAHWTRLSEAIPAAPIYAPPWNVLTKNVREALGETPLRAVSLYGMSDAAPLGLPEINTHIDVMKWRPARFRGRPALLERLWRQMRLRRTARRWDEPVGLLTHHRNLDPAAWDFLEAFLARTTGGASTFVWRSAADLLTMRT